jgi:hypothetical protein
MTILDIGGNGFNWTGGDALFANNALRAGKAQLESFWL